jgi:hypothetical protein
LAPLAPPGNFKRAAAELRECKHESALLRERLGELERGLLSREGEYKALLTKYEAELSRGSRASARSKDLQLGLLNATEQVECVREWESE